MLLRADQGHSYQGQRWNFPGELASLLVPTRHTRVPFPFHRRRPVLRCRMDMCEMAAMQHAKDQQRLMSDGMSAAEACNALDAAGAEGRRVGSAAEERQCVLDQAAKERRAQALVGTGTLAVDPGVKNLLVIDGTGTSSNFMSEGLLLLAGDAQIDKPTTDEQLRAVEASLKTWQGLRHERLGLEGGERPDRLELCRRAISSGRFHAIILSDLSEVSRAIPAVERELGSTLQRFAEGGGAIAVTTCDSAMTLPMLQRLFGVTWTSGGYYRTTWGPCLENATVAATFPGALATSSFSAKAHAVRNVPKHERLFGTTPDSCSQSLVPSMAGREVCKRADADSVTGTPEDYDVVVARHTYGVGALALFCDINMEPATVQLCLGFCRLASPLLPADGAARLEPDECARAAERKAEGNAAFGARDFAAAAAAYDEVLSVYGERGGAAGVALARGGGHRRCRGRVRLEALRDLLQLVQVELLALAVEQRAQRAARAR